MGRIPEETIEAIRNRTDIVDLIGRYVSLRQTGRSFKGLCPFHQEKTPSFHVHPERQIFHCFGCGEGGNGFVFLMKHENLSFPEAARSLASLCGIEIPETESEPGEAGLLRRLREATAAAQSHYRTELLGAAGQVARAYLEQRGIDLATAQRFGLGYAPDSWDALARALGKAQIPAELGERAGLLAERKSGGHYDRLRGRVTFPIQDVRGDVVAFGGRVLPSAAPKPDGDEGPKYLNTPESPLFRKREAFYGLPEALEAIRRSERAIIVEGYFDRIALARAGMPESLATCGTALTPEHARQLRRRTREVVLLFDGDEAGQRAVERSLAILLPEGVRVRAAALPPADDPDSVLARDGAEALRAIVDAAVPAVEAVIRRVSARAHATPWEKSDAVAAVAPLLALVADPVERGEHERQLALAVGVRPEDVKALVRREHAQRSGAAHARDDAPLAGAELPVAVEPVGSRSALAARRRAPADPVSGAGAQRRRPRDRGTAPRFLVATTARRARRNGRRRRRDRRRGRSPSDSSRPPPSSCARSPSRIAIRSRPNSPSRRCATSSDRCASASAASRDARSASASRKATRT